MWNSRPSKDKLNTYPSDNHYKCSNYRQYTKNCTIHYISSPVIENLILSAIKRVCYFSNQNKKEFAELIQKSTHDEQKQKIKEDKEKLKVSTDRYNELDNLVKTLYETFASGKLNEKHFNRLLTDYDEEQAELEISIVKLKVRIADYDGKKLKSNEFSKLINKYTDFTELTTPMLNEFIEKVVVYETEKVNKTRNQRVDIHFNFIGQVVLPADFITPEELEEEKELQAQQIEKEKQSKELEKARGKRQNEKRKEIVARKKAGLLTAEELEQEEIYLQKRRERMKKWRDKTKIQEEKTKNEKVNKNEKSGDLLQAC